MNRRGTLFAAAMVAAVGAVLAAAQEAKPPAFDATVNVVAVPVFVTDGQGRAVAGLRKEDFIVQDDGDPVEVVGFEAFDSGDPAMADRLEEAPAARRQFLLLFDLSFSSISGLVRARRAAESFVADKLRPTDLAAVATLSVNHGVRVLLTFTSDHAQVRRAIQTLGIMTADPRLTPWAIF